MLTSIPDSLIAVMVEKAIFTGVWRKLLSLVLIVVCAGGLLRVSFDTDILGMLPDELSEVRGLQAQRDVLEDGGEVIVVLECEEVDAGLLKPEVESLAKALLEAGVVSEARWRPVWEEAPEGLGELVAYLWLNGEGEEFAQLEARLAEGKADATFAAAVDRLGHVMDGQELAMRAHDPFGFLAHRTLSGLLEGEGDSGGFESGDGRMHLLFVRPVGNVTGYKEAAAWLGEIETVVGEWQSGADRGWLNVRYTGGPVFEAEIGGGMEHDMRGTVGVTMTLVCLLFWLFQRRLRPLLWLGVMLGVVFLCTLGLGGLLIGRLSMMSAGFASILVGLAVDYGMVICQEARIATSDPRGLRRAVAPGILWAAATTAAVFGSLVFSSLPGVRQLGLLVAIGILVGATVMLVLYLPLLCRQGVLSPANEGKRAGFLPPRVAAGTLLVLIGSAVAVLWVEGVPGLTFDLSAMRPRDSKAMATIEAITRAFPAWQEKDIAMVVEAESDDEMLGYLDAAKGRLDAGIADGTLVGGKLPLGLWPDLSQQRENRAAMTRLLGSRSRLFASARSAGFNDTGLGLAVSVFAAFERFANQGAEGAVFPDSPAAAEMLRTMVRRNADGAGGVVMGTIRPTAALPLEGEELVRLRRLNGQGTMVTGWPLLQSAILPLVVRDIWRVFLPMGLVLVVMLVVVFRNTRDVVLVSLCLILPGLVLSAVMRGVGLQWDFLNITAVPLLLGMGMDYGIHMVLALRRHVDTPGQVWHGIGKALLFCGTSTAIGFGSLALASNEALAGMGRVCAGGILLTMFCAVFVLPGCWTLVHRGSPKLADK